VNSDMRARADRSDLPVFDRSPDGPGFASGNGAAFGGYVLAEAGGGTPDVLGATRIEPDITLGRREYVGNAVATIRAGTLGHLLRLLEVATAHEGQERLI
jgi:hypothetical protein